jgi:hypothetical protein
MRDQERIQPLLCVLALLSALAACNFQETDLTELPVEISQADAQGVNVDVIVENVQKQVRMILPEAYLTMFVFTGRYQGLPELHGQVHLQFVQVESFPFYQRVLVALTSVDTVQETLEIRTRDYSDRYWSTEPLPLQDVSIAREIADIADKHIADLGIPDCDVTLSSVGRIWHVLCTQPGSGPVGSHLCEFEIDAATGQIMTGRQ